jgi:o-succinylbenzoate synthase
MTNKETWFITIENNNIFGIGECGILRGLSIDDRPDYERKLQWTCQNIHLGVNQLWDELIEFPSIQFGVEMAFKSLENNKSEILFPSQFTEGKKSININGLVWMGNEDFMLEQIKDKIANSFQCIKLKIGAIDFEKELALIRFIRQHFTAKQIEIRLDANGAFDEKTCLNKLMQLSQFEIHSIEQPLPKGSDLYAEMCLQSPIDIALDEELIGVFSLTEKEKLLIEIQPKYIILKPSFVGGFKGTKQWIDLAEKHKIDWWITSALESNIGLNAIAQWTFLQQNTLPQGLGTGGLYTNNFDCSLQVLDGQLWFNKSV